MTAQAPSVSFRPGTLDEMIYNAACTYNEYRLPERFKAADVIIDIGAHIGSFCLAALTRGAQTVVAFEADSANFACARSNLAPYGGRVQLRNQAVWRSDQSVRALSFAPSWDPRNTGGGNVLWADSGPLVEAVAFDDVLRSVTRDGKGRIRLVKIDCEGSEFPILLTSSLLHLADSIVGEYHECGGAHDTVPMPQHARLDGVPAFTIDVLATKLERDGFTLDHFRHKDAAGDSDTNQGMFFAHRRTVPRPAFLSALFGRFKARAHTR